MKTCPICDSVAFDDQALCFGCLHDYRSAEPEEQGSGPAGMPLAGAEAESGFGATQAKQIAFKLVLEPVGSGVPEGLTWSCSVAPA